MRRLDETKSLTWLWSIHMDRKSVILTNLILLINDSLEQVSRTCSHLNIKLAFSWRRLIIMRACKCMWIPYPAVKCLYACTCVKSWKQCNNFLVDRQVHYLLRASIMLSQGGSNLQKLLLFSKKKLLRHTRCRKVVNKFDPASTGI